MNGELHWPFLDRLIDKYAVVAAYVDHLPELERQIGEAVSRLHHVRPTMHDFTCFLSPRIDQRDQMVRSIAWAAQHVFQARSWCVGTKIIQIQANEKRITTSLVDQSARFGFHPGNFNLKQLDESWKDFVRQDTIDAVLPDVRNNRITVVKGQSISTARRISRKLSLGNGDASLFGTDSRFIYGLNAQSDAVAAVLFCAEVLKGYLPDVDVRPVFMTIDDPGCSWRFQAHDLSQFELGRLKDAKVNLDQTPVVSTYSDFSNVLNDDPDAFSSLPYWGTEDCLAAAPVDMPTRVVMLLTQLYRVQANATSRLAPRSPSELAAEVTQKYGVTYTKDMYRHDTERLERAGLVQPAPDATPRYGLTARGVARVMLLEQRFNPMIPRVAAPMLEAVVSQERLWERAAVV
jgi:hypothetical protein